MERTKYARLCLEMDTSTPLPPKIQVGHLMINITYEIKVELCVKC